MRILVAFLLFVLLIAGILAFWWLRKGNEPINGNGTHVGHLPDPERLAELLALHKRGVALAENDKKEESIALFEEVAKELPEEPAPVRNIAIVRLIAYEEEPTQENLEALDESFARWEPLEGNRALFDRLRGRKLAFQREFNEALAALNAAVELNPDDPTLWFAIYDVTLNTFDEEITQYAPNAVEHAYELEPNNLILAFERAFDQAVAADPTVIDTLNALEELVIPTNDWIEQNLAPPSEYFADLRSAAESSDWDRLRFLLTGFWNVVKISDQQHSDRNRMQRHPLEFIAGEFSPDVMNQITTAVNAITNDVEVELTAGDHLPLDNIRDLHLADINLDGRLDLCLLAGTTFQVYWGHSDTGWDPGPQVELTGEFDSFVARDLDEDKQFEFEQTVINPAHPLPSVAKTADLDVVLIGPAGVLGLRNELDPQSRECNFTAIDLNSLFDSPPECGGLVVGDFDSDGDLDLLLDTNAGTALLWNIEQWKFEVQSSETFNLPEGFRWSHADIADIDRDVDMDIVIAGNDGALGYLEGLRHHAFRWRELSPSDDGTSGPVSVADFDANASWDVLSTGIDGLRQHLSQTTGRGAIHWHAPRDGFDDIAPGGFRTWDFDNDSLLDVLAWDSDGARVLRGVANGFIDGPEISDGEWDNVVGADVGDLDLDGDLDAVVADATGVRTIINDGGNANRWVDLLVTSSELAEGGVQGIATKRVNNSAIGSIIEIRADGVYQAHIIDGQRTHIGLGNANEIEIIRAIWTNGAPENYLDVEPLQVLAERQTIITSCPYLYTWNGTEFVFVTDLLWAAPLGLPDPAGGLIPDRHWEYIRIPGDMLAPSESVYRLQITEELWEASYLDRVQLIAVDHPIGVDVFTNEKVGPPSVAEHRIYTVSDPRTPVAAVNHRGEDVLSEIASADEQYLVQYRDRHMQGYTEDTTLELDLGEFPGDAEIVLYLSGWIRPTDANLNVRLQQNESLPGPQAPRVEIPDGNGGWRELIGYMGHPGGKTKTIAVPIPNEFVDEDHRIRITTSMELYWDHIFFTVNEPAVEVRETTLQLVSADLHYRGVSALVPHPHNGPELYDYSRVATEPRFAPMEGRFTKFGDVSELLTNVDARHVVFGCGDELTLGFAVPEEPLPEGWTRDFVLYNVGWEKDCNTNGVLGRTTEPYPFVGMSAYPYPSEEAPSGPEYQQYLDTWQTREMQHLPYLRFVQRFDPDSPTANNPTIISDLLP